MGKKNISQEQAEVVRLLLKKSEEKDKEPQRHIDDVNKEEIRELTKKIKERIKV